MVDYIASGSPIRQNTLAAIYNNINAMLEPPFEKGGGTVVPDGTAGATDVISTTSTTFIPVSPVLAVTFTHDVARCLLVFVPVSLAVSTVTTVVEMGVSIDGVVDTNSILRLGSNATIVVSPVGSPHLFVTAQVPAGTFTIRPVMRVVSGAAGTVAMRFNQWNRVVVRDL